MSLKVTKTDAEQATAVAPQTSAKEETNIRTCVYCGGLLNLVGECDCDGVIRAKRIERSRSAAKEKAYELFVADYKSKGFFYPTQEGAVTAIEKMIDAVADDYIASAVIQITPNQQCKVSMNNKGRIQVERVDKKSYALTEED